MKAHKSGGSDMSDNYEHRITKLETEKDSDKASLIRIESSIKSLSESMEKRLDKLDNRLWHLFLWSISSYAALLYVIAKAVHWLH